MDLIKGNIERNVVDAYYEIKLEIMLVLNKTLLNRKLIFGLIKTMKCHKRLLKFVRFYFEKLS